MPIALFHIEAAFPSFGPAMTPFSHTQLRFRLSADQSTDSATNAAAAAAARRSIRSRRPLCSEETIKQ